VQKSLLFCKRVLPVLQNAFCTRTLPEREGERERKREGERERGRAGERIVS